MRVSVYQQMGTNSTKTEMEDRAVVGKNILLDGYHCSDHAGDGIYALLDGLGGVKGSSFASTFIARVLCDVPNSVGVEELQNEIKKAHTDLLACSNTATTLSGLMINQSQVVIYHIGNCRIYGFISGYLRQLTTDQTMREVLLRRGYAETEIPESANCSMLACLGLKDEYVSGLTVTDITSQFGRYSRILLTSDGVHDHVDEKTLESMMNDNITKEALESIIQMAIENGSQDDLSIMVLEK